jgi:hypothetical protein
LIDAHVHIADLKARLPHGMTTIPTMQADHYIDIANSIETARGSRECFALSRSVIQRKSVNFYTVLAGFAWDVMDKAGVEWMRIDQIRLACYLQQELHLLRSAWNDNCNPDRHSPGGNVRPGTSLTSGFFWKTMRLTVKAINDELARRGYSARLAKSAGYFYFQFGEAALWLDRTVNVPTLNSLTLSEWIAEFELLSKLNGKDMRGHRGAEDSFVQRAMLSLSGPRLSDSRSGSNPSTPAENSVDRTRSKGEMLAAKRKSNKNSR